MIAGKLANIAWNFTQAPRNAGLPLILATKCGKVTKSSWLPPSKKDRRPTGRFNMLATGEEPVAWMPWPDWPAAGRGGT